jgi:hypothetical protein
MYFAFMSRDRFNRRPLSPVTFEEAPGKTVEDKLQALLTTGVVGGALRKIVDEANQQLADQDQFTLEGLPEKLRNFVESRGGEVKADSIYWELFGVSKDQEDYRTKGISLMIAWMCDAGVLEKRIKHQKGQSGNYEVLAIPTPRKAAQPQEDSYSRELRTRSAETYERDGDIYDMYGFRIGRAPEQVDPNTAAALELRNELRSMPIRPLSKRARKRPGRG